MLATAGDLLFWGDIGQVLRAFDAETGEVLWESEPLGATIQTSTITYAVDGKQYVAVVNAESLLGAPRLAAIAGATIPAAPGELDQRVRVTALRVLGGRVNRPAASAVAASRLPRLEDRRC